MTGKERGFLLLTSHLGNPERKVLTTAQLRTLAQRVQGREVEEADRDLTEKDLYALGYNREMSQRIVSLLDEEELLDHYLARASRAGCVPITRVSEGYPLILRQRLGLDAPGCLWVKGNASLLNAPAISLVGSRDLREANRAFAAEVGCHAARDGLVLASGNARGADRTAQVACLRSGGKVISIVADELGKHTPSENLLYVSEDGFDEPFTAQRALSRNRCIHALGRMVFVAQSDRGKGGTWDGTAKNLHFGWSTVACFDDGSEAVKELERLGAYLVKMEELGEFVPQRKDFYFL